MTKLADHATRSMAKLADTQAQLGPLADEIFAATTFIVDHGALAMGTPQSQRLIAACHKLAVLAGRSARMPADYPKARPSGWPWDEGDGR